MEKLTFCFCIKCFTFYWIRWKIHFLKFHNFQCIWLSSTCRQSLQPSFSAHMESTVFSLFIVARLFCCIFKNQATKICGIFRQICIPRNYSVGKFVVLKMNASVHENVDIVFILLTTCVHVSYSRCGQTEKEVSDISHGVHKYHLHTFLAF